MSKKRRGKVNWFKFRGIKERLPEIFGGSGGQIKKKTLQELKDVAEELKKPCQSKLRITARYMRVKILLHIVRQDGGDVNSVIAGMVEVACIKRDINDYEQNTVFRGFSGQQILRESVGVLIHFKIIRAKQYQKEGELDKCKRTLKEVVDNKRESGIIPEEIQTAMAPAFHMLGKILESENTTDDAIAIYEKFTNTGGKDASILCSLVECYAIRGLDQKLIEAVKVSDLVWMRNSSRLTYSQLISLNHSKILALVRLGDWISVLNAVGVLLNQLLFGYEESAGGPVEKKLVDEVKFRQMQALCSLYPEQSPDKLTPDFYFLVEGSAVKNERKSEWCHILAQIVADYISKQDSSKIDSKLVYTQKLLLCYRHLMIAEHKKALDEAEAACGKVAGENAPFHLKIYSHLALNEYKKAASVLPALGEFDDDVVNDVIKRLTVLAKLCGKRAGGDFQQNLIEMFKFKIGELDVMHCCVIFFEIEDELILLKDFFLGVIIEATKVKFQSNRSIQVYEIEKVVLLLNARKLYSNIFNLVCCADIKYEMNTKEGAEIRLLQGVAQKDPRRIGAALGRYKLDVKKAEKFIEFAEFVDKESQSDRGNSIASSMRNLIEKKKTLKKQAGEANAFFSKNKYVGCNEKCQEDEDPFNYFPGIIAYINIIHACSLFKQGEKDKSLELVNKILVRDKDVLLSHTAMLMYLVSIIRKGLKGKYKIEINRLTVVIYTMIAKKIDKALRLGKEHESRANKIMSVFKEISEFKDNTGNTRASALYMRAKLMFRLWSKGGFPAEIMTDLAEAVKTYQEPKKSNKDSTVDVVSEGDVFEFYIRVCLIRSRAEEKLGNYEKIKGILANIIQCRWFNKFVTGSEEDKAILRYFVLEAKPEAFPDPVGVYSEAISLTIDVIGLNEAKNYVNKLKASELRIFYFAQREDWERVQETCNECNDLGSNYQRTNSEQEAVYGYKIRFRKLCATNAIKKINSNTLNAFSQLLSDASKYSRLFFSWHSELSVIVAKNDFNVAEKVLQQGLKYNSRHVPAARLAQVKLELVHLILMQGNLDAALLKIKSQVVLPEKSINRKILVQFSKTADKCVFQAEKLYYYACYIYLRKGDRVMPLRLLLTLQQAGISKPFLSLIKLILESGVEISGIEDSLSGLISRFGLEISSSRSFVVTLGEIANVLSRLNKQNSDMEKVKGSLLLKAKHIIQKHLRPSGLNGGEVSVLAFALAKNNFFAATVRLLRVCMSTDLKIKRLKLMVAIVKRNIKTITQIIAEKSGDLGEHQKIYLALASYMDQSKKGKRKGKSKSKSIRKVIEKLVKKKEVVDDENEGEEESDTEESDNVVRVESRSTQTVFAGVDEANQTKCAGVDASVTTEVTAIEHIGVQTSDIEKEEFGLQFSPVRKHMVVQATVEVQKRSTQTKVECGVGITQTDPIPEVVSKDDVAQTDSPRLIDVVLPGIGLCQVQVTGIIKPWSQVMAEMQQSMVRRQPQVPKLPQARSNSNPAPVVWPLVPQSPNDQPNGFFHGNGTSVPPQSHHFGRGQPVGRSMPTNLGNRGLYGKGRGVQPPQSFGSGDGFLQGRRVPNGRTSVFRKNPMSSNQNEETYFAGNMGDGKEVRVPGWFIRRQAGVQAQKHDGKAKIGPNATIEDQGWGFKVGGHTGIAVSKDVVGRAWLSSPENPGNQGPNPVI